MQRGQRSIYNSLFPEETLTDTLATLTERKGRSEMLILKRNEYLICRYYYFARIMGKKYPACQELLKEETFLEKRTIINIIEANQDFLRHLKNHNADIKFFKSKYPHIVWSY
jgi:hypothetical protein